MNKKKIIKTILSASLLIPAAAVAYVPAADAATSSQIASAVQKAVSASQILRRATSIEYNGDGKTRPYTEFNNTKATYSYAVKLVKTMPVSKTKEVYLAKLEGVQVQINNAIKYIDAITAGEKILKKKAQLQAHVDKGILTAETLELYHSLSYEIKKQARLLDPVYGKTTREAIRAYYKESAERLRDELSYPVTVKMALKEISASSTNQELGIEGKKVLLFISGVPQASYKKQLEIEWEQLRGKIPVDAQDSEFKNLDMIYTNLKELETIIQPGVSSLRVPVLYEETKTGISKVTNTGAKQKMDAALEKIMDKLFLPVSEIKTLLTKKAVEKGLPPEIVKAIALTENGGFQQFTPNGEVFKSFDNGYGIMQVTPLSETDNRYNWEKVKYDLSYNIETGINILLDKWKYASTSRIPVVNGGEKEVLENWYFAVMAYNGLTKRNDPTTASGKPYQVKVYENLASFAYKAPELIKKEDIKISYNQATGQMLFSEKLQYSTGKQTKSSQLYKNGETIVLPADGIRLRNMPTTDGNILTTLDEGASVTIISEAIEDSNKYNLFTWYKIKVKTTGQTGYVASIW